MARNFSTPAPFIPRLDFRSAQLIHQDHAPEIVMLARQLLLRQARSAGAGRPAYLACTTPRPRPQRRGVSTSQRTRPAATGSRTTIGAATAVNVDTVPTFVGTKSSNVGLTKNELRNLEREYKNYLQNPYKLANAVKNRLEKNRYEEALVLARRASKDGQVVVSWNLLIDYTFGKQRLHAAIKLFNEVPPSLWTCSCTQRLIHRYG